MHRCNPLALFIAIASFAVPAVAQVTAQKNNGGIAMRSVVLLDQDGTGPQLIGGTPAQTEHWPASFYSAAAGARCTATLVGPRALLLAAHCVGNDKDAEIALADGSKILGRCTHAADWNNGNGDESADYALCRMARPIPDLVFENVNLEPSRIKIGDKLLLTGYGCTQPPALPGGTPSGGNDGIFRIGEAKVVAIPGAAGNEPNTILTRDTTTVCPGDSGGGAYIVIGGDVKVRVLVSVNSRVWYEKGESYLSSTSSAAGVTFIGGWISTNGNEKICGVNLTGAPCR